MPGRIGFLPPGGRGPGSERGRWAFGLSALETKLLLGGYKGMDAWANLVALAAKTGPWVPVDTSHLASNIRAGNVTAQPVAKFSVLVGLGKEVPYARAQEMGSGLFAEFGPKKKIEIWAGALNPGTTKSLDPKMALAFGWEGAPASAEHLRDPKSGLFLFGRVMHPGVKPNRFLRAAVAEKNLEGRKLLLLALRAELT